MAITLFGIAAVPTDGASATNATTTITITPPSSMVEGQLCYVRMERKAGASAFSVGVTGGQTWYWESFESNGTLEVGAFWCRFNGTWSANPRFDFGGGTATSARMIVMSASASTKYWALDGTLIVGTFTAGTTPFTKTINSYNTVKASTVAIAGWSSHDDNTWGSLSGTGWSQTGLSAQYRNVASTDMSAAMAYRIQTSTGATNNVSLNQATLGGDAGHTSLAVFYERDNDYIGYPTVGSSISAFSSGDAVFTKRIAHKSGQIASAEFYVSSTSGSNSLYASLYVLNGSNFDFITSVGPLTFNTAGFYRIAFPVVVTAGQEYWLGCVPNAAADFTYAFYPGVFHQWAFVHNVGSFGSAPTWPSTITVASPSGGYFDSNCSFTLVFGSEVDGKVHGNSAVVGTLTGKGALSGRPEGNSWVVGTITGKGALSGRAEGTSWAIGDITYTSSVSGAMDGRADSYSYVIGTLTAKGILAGNAHGNSSVIGALTAKGELNGKVQGNTSVVGALTGQGALSGSVHGTSYSEGQMTGSGSLFGNSHSHSYITGQLSAIGTLQGFTTGESSMTGTLLGFYSITGLIQGNSHVIGQLTGKGALAGQASGFSSAVGNLIAIVDITGRVWGYSSVTGAITGIGVMVGKVSGSSSGTGVLKGTGNMSGAAHGNSWAGGRLSYIVDISGHAYGTSWGKGDLTFLEGDDFTIFVRPDPEPETTVIKWDTAIGTSTFTLDRTIGTTTFKRDTTMGTTTIKVK